MFSSGERVGWFAGSLLKRLAFPKIRVSPLGHKPIVSQNPFGPVSVFRLWGLGDKGSQCEREVHAVCCVWSSKVLCL